MTEDRRFSKDKKICSLCEKDTTVVIRKRKTKPQGYKQYLWHRHKQTNKRICHNCYMKLYISSKWNPIKNPERHKIYNPRRLKFNGKYILLSRPPRIGVCNWCRAVIPFDCKQTQMHHLFYDPLNPLLHTIEICPRCHTLYHHDQRPQKS
jgi:hypothetical protein